MLASHYKRICLRYFRPTFLRVRAVIVYKVPKKLFRVSMGILKSKINFWNLPYIILITVLLALVTVLILILLF